MRLRDPDVEAVRAWFGDRGRGDFTWWLGPSTRPSDLAERLQAEPYARHTAMALTEEPPEVPEVEVRRVDTFEEYLLAQEISFEAWDSPEEQRRLQRDSARERWERRRGESFLALVDGRPAGRGGVQPLVGGAALTGGAVAQWARGRGAYRALVRARWDEAVARGTPTLVVQARPDTSQPILERLGFRTVCTVELLRDRA
ncbi:MAG: GNAT family N-acetyltransferase [Gaiellaceae bacterium]